MDTAYCKPYTAAPPRYLIPYYLRDVRTHFRHYASVRKGKQLYMTVEDLVAALLAIPPSTASTGASSPRPVVTPPLRALFDLTDANQDGLVSFSEFRVLSALMQLQTRELSMLFRLADKDKVGALTVPQLALLLYTSTGDEALYHSLVKGYPRSSIPNGASTPETEPTRVRVGCSDSTAIIPDNSRSHGSDHPSLPVGSVVPALGVLQNLFGRRSGSGEVTASFLSPHSSCSHKKGRDDLACGGGDSGCPCLIPRCTEEDILGLKEEVEEEVWTAEFMRFAEKEQNSLPLKKEEGWEPPPLSGRQFMQLVASRVIGPHPPYYLEANIRKLSNIPKAGKKCETTEGSNSESKALDGEAPSSEVRVPLTVWLALNKVMKHAEEVSDVFAFFASKGHTIRRDNIEKVFRAAGVSFEDVLPLDTPTPSVRGEGEGGGGERGVFKNTSIPLSDSVTDLLFAVFDKNGDGQIDLEECLSVLRQSRQFYYLRNKIGLEERKEKIRAGFEIQKGYMEKLQDCASQLFEVEEAF